MFQMTSYLVGSHKMLHDFLSFAVVKNGRLISLVPVPLPALQTVPNSHTTHCAQKERHTNRFSPQTYKEIKR